MSAHAIEAARRYIEIDRPERALESLAELDSDTAQGAEARWLRGLALCGVEDFDRAADEARAALADAPHDVDALALLAFAEQRRGRLGRAETAIRAALEQAPGRAELLAQCAGILMQGGRLDEAERMLDDAAASDPDLPDVLEQRIVLACLRGDDRAFRQFSEELLAIDPESVHAHHALGVLALNRGRPRTAAARFGEVVRADPGDDERADDARLARRMARNPVWWPTLFHSRIGRKASFAIYAVLLAGMLLSGRTTATQIAFWTWALFWLWAWAMASSLEPAE